MEPRMTKRRSSWRRWVVRGAVCVVLGVLTTVGVAWGLAAGEFVKPLAYRRERIGENILYRVEVVSGIGRVRRAAYEAEPYSIPILPLIAFGGDSPTPPTELRHASERWGRLVTAADPDVKRLDREGKDEACGWPRLALWCEFGLELGPTGRIATVQGGIPLASRSGLFLPEGRALPCRPVWSGFVINSISYALLWLPLVLLAEVPPIVRRAGRKRRGHCAKCDYDLVHKFDDGCPECGWNRA